MQDSSEPKKRSEREEDRLPSLISTEKFLHRMLIVAFAAAMPCLSNLTHTYHLFSCKGQFFRARCNKVLENPIQAKRPTHTV